MIDRIELRHLRYFVAVAEELHFGRAAKRLGIAQPPLSLQIQRLEAELGTMLFDRTSRRVQLTSAGRVLLDEGRRTLKTFHDAADATVRASRGEIGSLTVSFASSVIFLVLPDIIREFRARFPGVRLELRELPTAVQMVAIQAGDLDLGFVREPPAVEELETETMMTEQLLLAISKRHPLARRKHVRLADVADEDFVLFPRDIAPGLHSHVLRVCAQAGVHPRVVLTSRELSTTLCLVDAGLGVTIIPASVRLMGVRGVRYFPIGSPPVLTRIAAAWHVDNQSPIVRSFLEVARGAIRPLAAGRALVEL